MKMDKFSLQRMLSVTVNFSFYSDCAFSGNSEGFAFYARRQCRISPAHKGTISSVPACINDGTCQFSFFSVICSLLAFKP